MKKILLLSLLTLNLSATTYYTEVSNSIYKKNIVIKKELNNKNSTEDQITSPENITADFSLKACSNWHCYGYLNFNDTNIDFQSNGNGWYMLVVDPTNNTVISSTHYPTFTNTTVSNNMVNDILNIQDGNFVMIATQDEPSSNSGNIPNVIANELNGSNVSGIEYRGSYIYAGYKGGNVIVDQKVQSYDNSNIRGVEYNSEVGNVVNDEFLGYSSCKEILEAGESVGDGVYTINNGVKDYSVYCNMSTNSGGWTLVAAQFEQDPVTNWNEGIQADYDPTLSTNRGFALNSSELPDHTLMATAASTASQMNVFGAIYTYQYTTGNIPVTLINDTSGNSYHIHRDTNYRYGNNDPEMAGSTGNPELVNVLTIDITGRNGFTFAFAPNDSNPFIRGYGYFGDRNSNSDNFAWAVWVR